MENDINNNNGFYKDLDSNFKLACELSEQVYTHDKLLNMLETGNIPQKQIAALNFDYVSDRNDAEVLINNLIGCDGKIREAVALKINNLISADEKVREIFADFSSDVFAKATVDINANICRLVVDSAVLLKNYNYFASSYSEKIINQINDALSELDKFIFRDKKYVINKQLFKLYWCLEALADFYPYVQEDVLYEILKKCAYQQEYTIREKVAQILIKSGKFEDIKDILKNDENYYVRQMLHHPSFF